MKPFSRKSVIIVWMNMTRCNLEWGIGIAQVERLQVPRSIVWGGFPRVLRLSKIDGAVGDDLRPHQRLGTSHVKQPAITELKMDPASYLSN